MQSRGNRTGHCSVIRDGCSVAVGRFGHMGHLDIGAGHGAFSNAARPVLTRDIPLGPVTCNNPGPSKVKRTTWPRETAT